MHLSRDYDQRYQITGIHAGQLDVAYTRDAAGQVITMSGAPEPTLSTGSWNTTINSANNQVASAGNAVWSHDANGNVVADGVYAYTWDALNRLIRITENGSVIASYGYDSQNRRISKTVGSQTILYHYDLDSRLIAETLADGTPIRDYFWLDGEPLAVREYQANPGLYYYINDQLGAPLQLITPAGGLSPLWRNLIMRRL